MERYFNRESARRFEEAKRLCRFVIGTVRRAIGEARKYAERYGRDVTGLRSHLFSLKSREMEPAVWMLGALAYLSLYHAENFLAAKKKLLGRVADSGSSGAGAGYVDLSRLHRRSVGRLGLRFRFGRWRRRQQLRRRRLRRGELSGGS